MPVLLATALVAQDSARSEVRHSVVGEGYREQYWMPQLTMGLLDPLPPLLSRPCSLRYGNPQRRHEPGEQDRVPERPDAADVRERRRSALHGIGVSGAFRTRVTQGTHDACSSVASISSESTSTDIMLSCLLSWTSGFVGEQKCHGS